ncbi:MAG: SDR family oxidoreductase [bacterium]|nr:SDR family oxidoreductase [bacterium]MCP5070146.1 SDR family oxidoreductase [bacterium]
MSADVSGKTALITGASNRTGIGCAIARRMAAGGANVVLTDLASGSAVAAGIERGSIEGLQEIAAELADEHGVPTLALPLDVTDDSSVQAAVSAVGERFGRIDALFNNAGTVFGAPSVLHEYDIEAWNKTLDVNLTGMLRVTRAAVPLMQGAPGAIVNTASRAGKKPAATNGAYSVSKAGVIMATKVMAVELAPLGIRVNAICPGLIETDLQKGNVALRAHLWQVSPEEARERLLSTVPMARMGSVDEVAEVCAFLASQASSYITGQALNIGGGIIVEL